jgi:spermidine/putrescine-binding protein
MQILFDSRHKGRVVWRDRATEMIGLMATVMGLPLERAPHPRQWHLEPAELKRVKEELVKAKRQMQPLWYGSNTEAVKMFAGSEVDLGYNASFVVHELVRVKGPRVRAATKLRSPERLFGYVDALCLVKGAAHRDEALQFINWVTSLDGRRILFERNGYPDTDQALIDWAVSAGYRDALEARGVLNPAAVIPTMILFAPPTDLQAWVDAFNEVKAA